MILVTGFGPFGGHKQNPSEQIAKWLSEQNFSTEVEYRILPVETGKLKLSLEEAISQLSPKYILCLGLASGRKPITFEKVAINIKDFRIPDNAGEQPIDELIGKTAAYYSNLPLKAMVHGMGKAGFSTGLSFTAGTYICNQTFYHLMEIIEGTDIKGGFVHLPNTQELGEPFIELNEQCQAMQLAIQIMLETENDFKISLGEIC